MKKHAVHFSSGADLWGTPPDFYAELDDEFGFTLDVCANPETAKCARYFTTAWAYPCACLWAGEAAVDGLAQDWGRNVCWMNPPYSDLKAWLTKAADAASKGATVVCLIPARTDTKAWHRFVWDSTRHAPRPGVQVRLIEGRLKFTGAYYAAESSAPFPSAVVVFFPH